MNALARLKKLSIAAALGGVTLLALAQSGPDRGPQNRPGSAGGGGLREQRMDAGPDAAVFEGLSRDQRQSLREAFQKAQEKSRELGIKMREARQRMQDAIWSERLNESAIRERAKDVAKIEAELAIVRARVFASIRPKLSPDQIDRLRHLRGQMGDRLRERMRDRIQDRGGPGMGMRDRIQDRRGGDFGEGRPQQDRMQDRRRDGNEDLREPRDEVQGQRRDNGNDRTLPRRSPRAPRDQEPREDGDQR